MWLIAINHISYVDFILGGYGAVPAKRLVRFMAKEVLFRNRYSGPLMRGMHHIPVDREAGAASYRTAVDYLQAGVPVLPMILWGTQRMFTKDHPRDFTRHRPISISIGAPLTVTPDDDPAEATARLRSTMAGMLDESIRGYPEQPQGAWWLPAA